MGKYDDIWTRVKEFEDAKKERKKKSREEKVKAVEGSITSEDINPTETEEFEEISSFGSTIDCRIIKEYTPPLFVPGTPNMFPSKKSPSYLVPLSQTYTPLSRWISAK